MSDFIKDNSEAGFNERQVCWSIIVFVFAYWDEEVRPKIAAIREVPPNDVKLDALGDLRILRRSIIHNAGVLAAPDFTRLKKLAGICEPDKLIAPTHDQMHAIFVAIKQSIGSLILEYTGDVPGAPKADEITGVAIQNAPRG